MGRGTHPDFDSLIPLLPSPPAAIDFEDDAVRLEDNLRYLHRHARADSLAIPAQLGLGLRLIKSPFIVEEDAFLAPRQRHFGNRNLVAQPPNHREAGSAGRIYLPGQGTLCPQNSR
jgi:hypothetical protein